MPALCRDSMDEVLLDDVVRLGQSLVSVLQGQLGAVQQVANLLVLRGTQRPIGDAERPQTLLGGEEGVKPGESGTSRKKRAFIGQPADGHVVSLCLLLHLFMPSTSATSSGEEEM
ncbi:hypothetical protein EYF80_032961 [Liparis tanakae]|uniref:Uncharacterized protein n=1 Tax=Liparis tanakae TaxID=230148 RepID=A0A4Z2GUT5_9TELE|nr:hypothetical protein EYF80_032961 [Liparis tanakae]